MPTATARVTATAAARATQGLAEPAALMGEAAAVEGTVAAAVAGTVVEEAVAATKKLPRTR